MHSPGVSVMVLGRLKCVTILPAALLVLAALVSSCTGAPAPSPTPDPFVGLADRSDQAFRAGLELYGQGLYREALNSFQQAQTLSPTVDPRIDQMIERTREALAPPPTVVPPVPTAIPIVPTAVPAAMSVVAPDANLGANYFGKVTLAVVPGRDLDAPAATAFFFQDQIGLHIEGLKQHLRLPFELRVFNVDSAVLLADVRSDTNPNAQGGVGAQTPGVSVVAPPPTLPPPGVSADPTGVPTEVRLTRFWDTYVWYHEGGEAPGRYRVELFANDVLTNSFDYSVGSVPVPVGVAIATATTPTTTAIGQPAQVDGNWTGSLRVSVGPGSGTASSCTLAVAQDAASITGSAECDAFGSGSLTGTVTGHDFHLDVQTTTPLTIDAVVVQNGSQASGTYTASDGSSGTFSGTRNQPEAPISAVPVPASVPAAPVVAPAAPAAVATPTVEPTVVPIPTATTEPTPTALYATIVGGSPAGLDVDAVRGRFYVADSTGAIWSSDSPTGQQQPTLGTPVYIGARVPVDMAVDQSSGFLYLSTQACSALDNTSAAPPGCILVVDGRSGALLKSIALPGASGDLRIDSELGLLYVALPGLQQLGEVDIRAGKVIQVIEAMPQVTSLAVDPVRHMVYAAHLGGQLSVIDGRSGQVTERVSLTGPGLASVATARGLAYAINTATNQLAVLEPASQSVTRSALKQAPAAVAASETTGAVYVVSYVLSDRSNVITRIDPTDGSEIGRVILLARSGQLGNPPEQVLRPRLVVNRSDETVYATLPEAGSLAVVATSGFPALAREIPQPDAEDRALVAAIPGVLRPGAPELPPSSPPPPPIQRAQAPADTSPNEEGN